MARTCQHPLRQIRRKMALERQEKYSQLSLDEKIKQQEPFKGKQYKKLLAKKEAATKQAELKTLVSEDKVTNAGKLTSEQKAARRAAHKQARQDVR